MLDKKLLRTEPEMIRKMLQDRNTEFDLDSLLGLDRQWKELIEKGNNLKHQRNEVAKQIGQLKNPEEKKKIIQQTKTIAEEIKAADESVRELEEKIDVQLLSIPNVPQEDVPVGVDESDNKVVREHLQPRELGFQGKTHEEVGLNLGIIDIERGAKTTGSGFYILKGDGARLERAIFSFMLDVARERGYKEVMTPFLVNSNSMTGTGQLPKFEFDMYKMTGDDLFLVPTGEVPITNIHKEEIFEMENLPIKYCGYTPCFRREAGRHKEEKGIIRVHQFNKVELVKFVHPDRSHEELEALTQDAEEVLKRLELPYRVLLLCTGDLSFASSKTYDLEVHLPGQGGYLEVSSCSNFLDFQARRARIKFRPEPHLSSEFVHTLNGSGLAVGRTMVAILENYQNEDGSVDIPNVLQPYMGGQERIEPVWIQAGHT